MLSRDKFVIGTRGSNLALQQANYIAALVRQARPNMEVELKVVTTKGDQVTNKPVSQVGSKGVFTKELENELLNYTIDCAVHSMKDVPVPLDERFEIASMPLREDVREALVARDGLTFEELPEGATVGTSSLRRRAQLLAMRPDLNVVPIRGNVETRLKLVEDGKVDAVVLAVAGLNRLGLKDKITYYFQLDEIMPAAGQAAIGVEIRKGDMFTFDILETFKHKPTFNCVMGERAVVEALEGGCQVPIAVFAREVPSAKSNFRIDAYVGLPDGTKKLHLNSSGPADASKYVSQDLAFQMLKAGADDILNAAKADAENRSDEVVS